MSHREQLACVLCRAIFGLHFFASLWTRILFRTIAEVAHERLTMPPFGFDNDRVGLLQSSLSHLTEEIDHRGQDSVGSTALKNLLQRFEEENVPIELSCALQELFNKATECGERVRRETSYHIVMSKAVNSSIRIVLTEVLDQVAVLLEIDYDKRRVVAALTSSSIKQAFKRLQQLESMVLDADTSKLEPFLREFGEMDEDRPAIRISLLSRALAFEFMAGKIDEATISSSGKDDELGLRVKATPYLLAKSDDISENSFLLHQYKDCIVKVDYCSHKKLFTSSGSGVMGEAIVRMYVNPGEEVKIPKEGKVWSQSSDCDRLDLAEVRA